MSSTFTRPGIERLEDRCLLSVGPMTIAEQHFHELINWIRADPDGASQSYATPLNQGLAPGTITSDPKPPLARNDFLRDAIQGHLEDMQENNFFHHLGSNGSTFVERIEAAGYANWTNVGENLAWSGATGDLGDVRSVVEELVRGLFESAEHRKNLLTAVYTEAGTSFITGPFRQNGITYNAGIGGQTFGKEPGNYFLTGVGCTARYAQFDICDVTQAIVGATLTATRQSDGATAVATTGQTGEFDLRLPNGTWDVEISGGGLAAPLTFSGITVAGANVQLDFTPRKPTPWTNPNLQMDVNNDGLVTPLDALLLINSLNREGPRDLSALPEPPPFWDPNQDGFLTSRDVLVVVNWINKGLDEGGQGTGL